MTKINPRARAGSGALIGNGQKRLCSKRASRCWKTLLQRRHLATSSTTSRPGSSAGKNVRNVDRNTMRSSKIGVFFTRLETEKAGCVCKGNEKNCDNASYRASLKWLNSPTNHGQFHLAAKWRRGKSAMKYYYVLEEGELSRSPLC